MCDLNWCLSCGRHCDDLYCSVECRRTDSANGTVPVSDDDDGSGSYLDKVDLTVLSVHARSHLFNHEDNFVGQNHERTGAWSTPVSMGCSPTGSLGSSTSKTSFLLASPSQQPGRPRASSSEDTSVTSHRSGGHAVFASTFTGTRPVQQPQQGAGNRSVNSPSPPPQLLMEIRAHKTSSLLRDDLPRRRGLPFWQELFAEELLPPTKRDISVVPTIRLPTNPLSPGEATLHC